MYYALTLEFTYRTAMLNVIEHLTDAVRKVGGG
jgi:hypothetical protein